MRALVCAAAAVTAMAGSLQLAAQDAARELDAVRSTWSQLDARWNARDAAGFSELFSPDASFVFVDRGLGFEGRTAIHAHFAERFAELSEDLRHFTEIRTSEVLEDNVVAADGTVSVRRVLPDSAGIETIRHFAIFTVMQRDGEALQIRFLRVYGLPVPAPD